MGKRRVRNYTRWIGHRSFTVAVAAALLPSCGPSGPPVEVTAAELVAAYMQNGSEADTRFKNHVLLVSGISGGVDSADGEYVLTMVPGIRAHLKAPTSEADLFQQVTVRCSGINADNGTINLDECLISPQAFSDQEKRNSAAGEQAVLQVPPISDELARAFEAVSGQRSAFRALTSDNTYAVTRPLQIVSLPFGKALLTEKTIVDGCHGCPGAIGVYYLNDYGGNLRVRGSWPEAVEGSGFGSAPVAWKVTSQFTKFPAIYAENEYMGQGEQGRIATITELRAEGPISSDAASVSYNNVGAVGEGVAACILRGEITNIRKDVSFDVLQSGSTSFSEHFVKRNGRFALVSKWPTEGSCGEP